MLRIVAGEWGGRRIRAPRGSSTRPTSDRVREAIFNVLAHRLPLERARFYDLYAGSGALGIEALSRGALHATFVETDGRNAALIRRNLQGLGAAVERWRVVGRRVLPWLEGEAFAPGPLVILLDPPYASDEAQRALESIARLPAVAEGAAIVVESAGGAAPVPPPNLELIQTKRYGDTDVSYLEKRSSTPPPADGSP
ncbi:MAG: 16S rRNA (guanine(966)-N(2))-methyltransferase RsmD [SAR324 cluster bacterium]|nr:16S rRNA (guanine(966)-N(2))-methyltransferase RsmD [SAR324 cluster bacterium]